MKEIIEADRRQNAANLAASGKPDNSEEVENDADWSPSENQLLVKAMTVFPVGTKSR